MSESANSINNLSEQPIPRVKNPELLARLVIRENKAFNESALLAGYSPSIAARGLKALCAYSSSVSEAIRRETESLISLDKLKPLAVKRLYEEIVNPKSSLGMKAIELAGRFKETDWFVRSADVQIGVFAALGEAGPTIDAVASVIPPED
jgi:hypothetical protein